MTPELTNVVQVRDIGAQRVAPTRREVSGWARTRPSVAFGELSGNAAQIELAAQDIVEDPLTHPGTTSSIVRTGRFKGGVEFCPERARCAL